jgi:hypothetical protein
MPIHNRFRVNTPQVTHETLDGEVVIINLDTGIYYSTNGIGAAIWRLLDTGVSVEQIVSTMTKCYTGDPQEIETEVKTLVDKFQQESLIVADDGAQTAATNGTVAAFKEAAELPPFASPILQKYSDMEDLLLLDPIHDVDETGWPNKEQDEK